MNIILNITADTRSLFVNPLRAILLRGRFMGKMVWLTFWWGEFVLQQ
jgi:hypothetical protein